ncbi:MAG: aldehyde ferredoxin oxidoreductase family protein [Synergistetes bacterium]|nr:aldehyde ferredoxin oxidoreductase family protein [Synergistota bacterium]MDW8193149.1 aldehyde ferredoxin oxidoreductase family protein [Synergistota bacterium]
MYGYVGKILYIDLTRKESKEVDLEERFAREYLGGPGFGAKILYEDLAEGTDPLSPENLLIVTSGPISGMPFMGSGRSTFVSKSPLTLGWMHSNMGGSFARSMKLAGYDVIVIKGKASEPLAVKVDNGRVEFLSASELWGKGALEAQDIFKERHGKDFDTFAIGPAGERLVKYACILGSGARAAGRGGLGAVMGSKSLKLFAVRGGKKLQPYDRRAFDEIRKSFTEAITKKLAHYTTYGTPFLVKVINEVHGGLGTRNFQDEVFEGALGISGETFREKHFIKNTACFGCPVACGKVFKSLRNSQVISEGPEYESIYALGSMCGISDASILIEADRKCDEYGLDTISAGVSVAFLMECYERGILTKGDVDGIDATFGNGEALLALLDKIAKREGIGDLLAEGTKRMAERIGKDAWKFAIHARGLELPGHSPRVLKVMAIGYAISNRGGSHHDSRPGPEYVMSFEDKKKIDGKARLCYEINLWTTLGDSLIICHFAENVLGTSLNERYLALVNSLTGFGLSLEELREISHRVYTLERCFNLREKKVAKEEDTLPWRILNERIPKGPAQGFGVTPEELEVMLKESYLIRGWDENGIPRESELKRLKLDFAIDDMRSVRKRYS